MILKRQIFIFFLFTSLFYSCAYEQIEKQAPFVNTVEKEERFRINLPENHINSESWHLVDDYDHQIINELAAVWHGNEKGIDFNLIALTSGECRLQFIKRKFQDSLESRLFIVKIVDK